MTLMGLGSLTCSDDMIASCTLNDDTDAVSDFNRDTIAPTFGTRSESVNVEILVCKQVQ